MNEWICYGVGAQHNPGRYYAESADENRPYLVVLKSSGVKYYAVTVTGTGLHEKATGLTLVNTPPADVSHPEKFRGRASELRQLVLLPPQAPVRGQVCPGRHADKPQRIQVGLDQI